MITPPSLGCSLALLASQAASPTTRERLTPSRRLHRSFQAIPETCPAASVCFNRFPPCHTPAARSAGGSLRPGARRGARRRVRAVRPGLKTYRKSSPGAPQAVDVALPRRVQLVRGSERLIADSPGLLGTGLLCVGAQLRPKLRPCPAGRHRGRRAGPAFLLVIGGGSGGIRTPGPSRDARFQGAA